MTDSNVIYGVDFKGNMVCGDPLGTVFFTDKDGRVYRSDLPIEPSSADTSPSEYVADSGDCA